MKKTKIILLILLNIYISNIFAQKYKLTGKILNTEQSKLIISEYNFNEMLFIDSININNEKISYDISQLKKGMYNIQNKDLSIDFIYNSENIDVFFDAQSNEAVKYNKSIENRIIDNYFLFYEENSLALKLLTQLEKYYPKTESFYKEITKKIKILENNNASYIDSISKNYPNSYSSEILKLYKKSDGEFLNKEIFYSTDLKNTVFLGDLLISYLNKFQKQDYTKIEQEKAFTPAIDNIFEGLSKNPELSIYVSEFLIDKFRYFDFDYVSEYIALKTLELQTNGICVDDEKLQLKKDNIEALLNVKLGKQAPNFSISKDKTLYDIKSDYKLIVFWASWCQHCEKLFEEMIEKQKNISDNVKIITYSLDYIKDDWEVIIKNFPKEWTNRCLCDDDNEKTPDSYAVYSTPTIFLLDDMNTIIDKPKNLQDIEGLIY